jgi:hypothetical protein
VVVVAVVRVSMVVVTDWYSVQSSLTSSLLSSLLLYARTSILLLVTISHPSSSSISFSSTL